MKDSDKPERYWEIQFEIAIANDRGWTELEGLLIDKQRDILKK